MYRILFLIKSIYKILTDRTLNDAESYYPEISRRKPKSRIIKEQIKHLIKYHSINEFYFIYGFDRVGFREEDSYVDYETFRKRRNILNNKSPYSPICILRNKFLFGLLADELGINTAKIVGVTQKEKIYILKEKRTIDFLEYINKTNLNVYFKSIDGECADGVFHLTTKDSKIYLNDKQVIYSDFKELLLSSSYILQEPVKQCAVLSNLHSNSVNTLRIETVLNNSSIDILPPLLRIGTSNKNVDNWAVGGLVVQINVEKNCLCEYGFYKPSFGTKVDEHPDSKIRFDGYNMPYLKEAIELVKKFHSFLPQIHSIGWDVAITEDGPCIIEGNDNWELSLVQSCSHGLKEEFEALFKKI